MLSKLSVSAFQNSIHFEVYTVLCLRGECFKYHFSSQRLPCILSRKVWKSLRVAIEESQRLASSWDLYASIQAWCHIKLVDIPEDTAFYNHVQLDAALLHWSFQDKVCGHKSPVLLREYQSSTHLTWWKTWSSWQLLEPSLNWKSCTDSCFVFIFLN